MLSRLVLALASATLAVPASSEPGEQSDGAIETITVEAAKVPISTGDISSSVSLIDSQRIERELAQSVADLIRYEPGVDVADQGSRFGLSGFSIRGIGGNRVKVEVDGVATADAFSIGSFSNASRDFVDVDSLKQVEIVRGPASAVFGSDALGGVVSFVTNGPADLLQETEAYLDVSAGYNSVDASSLLRGTAAVRLGSLAAMVRISRRDGEERGDLPVDPMQDSSENLLARFEWGDSGNGALSVALERFQADTQTSVDSLERVQDFTAAFGYPYVIDTSEVAGDDTRERSRITVGQEWLAGALGVDYLRWRAYAQNSETLQETFEARESVIGVQRSAVSRQRSFVFEQALLGLELNAASDFEFAGVAHQLSYGLEYERTDTEQLRDGTETNLLTGTTSKQVGPDLFPVRDFPESRTQRTGLYLQDRIAIGSLVIAPGVRWDRYELDPAADAIFAGDNPGVITSELTEERFSPKLGLLWGLTDELMLYAQYAEGFRAPPVNDVNVGFTNFQFGYTSLANPDLKSESSVGFELGARYAGQQLTWDLALFDTRYDDFIESFRAVGFDPVSQLLQFQSVNVDTVEIRGAELKARYTVRAFSEQLSVNLAIAYADGEDQTTGAALNSVAPLNGVLGLAFEPPSRAWGLNLVARAAARQNDLDESAGALLSPAGYLVYDAFGFWKIGERARLRAGAYNLSDREYTAYLDVRGIAADVANPDRYQRPGRHFSIAFDWTL
ncbi:MAG: TonB-dependent hemoglobin/transferrin/lactoferrin family receptor [Pseudomonadales bacterium]